jgi:hypothetical protein
LRARQAGASVAMSSLLRLSGSVEQVFLERMREAFPDRVAKMTSRIRDVRGGRLTNSEFFQRQEGHGTYWHMIQQLLRISKRKAGFAEEDDEVIPQTFRRPQSEQPSLF